MNFLPWQSATWQHLLRLKQNNCLPHALLWMGIAGLGKTELAKAFAAVMLCQAKTQEEVCGTCHSCHLIKAGTHPDLMIVKPLEDSKIIKIDQIREVVSFVNETPLQGVYRVIILHPANAMNVYAANALLKTLEEPTPNTLFILICEHSLFLPKTISSRCQKILFSTPPQAEALAWLQSQLNDAPVDLQLLLNICHGAPLKAVQWVREEIWQIRQTFLEHFYALSQHQISPLTLAATYHEKDPILILNLLNSFLLDLLKFKLTKGEAQFINFDYRPVFVHLGEVLTPTVLLTYLAHLQTIQRHLLAGMNLNRQLLLEELFIQWTHYVAR